MSNPKSSGTGADWTQLLADPDLVSHLGELLQTYRDAPPDKRDEALLSAMREIKNARAQTVPAAEAATTAAAAASPAPALASQPATAPPFEPDIFTPSWGEDRRNFPRLKCFVAVELRVGSSETPIWGNLANTSLGGCFVETATAVPSGANVEIGLWLANGKIWIKGVVLTGVITRTSPSCGVRVRFSEMEPSARETLRYFLKFVETSTKGYQLQHGYLAQLKR